MKITKLLGIALIGVLGFGQNPEIKPDLPTIIPPSPTVAALMKFEEIPVSNYTGIPDVSIPLFSSPTHSKDIGINIALKYHSSVGANDRASDVGLGWSLFAGGSISRIVRGLPDEQLVMADGNSESGKVGIYHTSIANHNNYYYQHSDNFPLFVYNNPFEANEYLWDIVETGKFDTEHDLWQFNFLGNSGRFYIKKNMQTNQLEVKPLDDYRVIIINNYITVGNNDYVPVGFTIYDEKGYKYIFDIVETTINKTAVENRFIHTFPSSVSADREFKSAFHLSKVYDNNNNLIIEFLFNNNPTFKEHFVNTTITVNDYTASHNNNHPDAYELMRTLNCYNEFKPLRSEVSRYSNISVKKLQTINIIGVSKIDIDYQQGRSDTNLLNPDKATFINQITLKNWKNEFIKKYKFEYGYSLVIDNRMMLKKVKELDQYDALNSQYELFYEQNDSYGYNISKDYWGYFNLTPTSSNVSLEFSNEPTPSFSTTDVLQKIKYPTGGCTIFNFEANCYSFIGDETLTNFSDNPDNKILINSETLSFTNSIIKTLAVSTIEDRNVKFYPSIMLNEDSNLDTRTFSLLKKVNGSWTQIYSFACAYNNENCSIDYVLKKNVEYAIKRVNLDFNYSGTDTLFIEYFGQNPIQKKYLYGGGNRIKEIGFFNLDVPQEYYKNTTFQTRFIPVKGKEYNYTLPTDTSKSSGSLVFAKPLFKYEDAIKIITSCPEPPYYSGLIGYDKTIGFITKTSFNNLIALKTQGADVGYKNVSVREKGNDNGIIDYEYTSPMDYPEEILFATTPPFLPSKNYDYKRGLLLKETIKNQNKNKLQEISYTYNFTNYVVRYGERRYKPNGVCFGGSVFSSYAAYIPFYENQQGPIGEIEGHNFFSSSNLCGYPANYTQQYFLDDAYGWAKLTNKVTKSYFYPNGSSTPNITQTIEDYTYNPINKQISENTVTNSNGEVLKTKYFYHTGNSIHSQNRIAQIESIETYRGTELLSKSKVNYGSSWQNNVSLLPQSIETLKGTGTLESRLQYKEYDEFGNPLEVQQEGGHPICYIWGYNKTLPIAKIENATYAQVQSHVANLQTLSNGNDENSLMTALNALRTALPNAMVTTYTHKPLIGISTVTDPKGDKITYHYDSFNRLEFVKDKDNNILSENKYHYKN